MNASTQQRMYAYAAETQPANPTHGDTAYIHPLAPRRGAAERDAGNKHWFSAADSLIKLTLDSGYEKYISSRVVGNIVRPYNIKFTIWYKNSFLYFFLPVHFYPKVKNIRQ